MKVCILGLAVVLVAGCGASNSGGPAAPEARSCGGHPVTLPVGPVTFRMPKPEEASFAIGADGSLLRNGERVGTIACDEVRNADGATYLIVKPDGSVVGGWMAGTAKFDGDELVVRNPPAAEMRMHVDDEGVLTLEARDTAHAGETRSLPCPGAAKAKRATIAAMLYWMSLRPMPR